MKLQPNFSWQKYENAEEDSKEQFQYQLQQQHIVVANAVNSTIDDESFNLSERMTSFTWVNGQPIWKKTLATVSWTGVGTVNTIPMGIRTTTALPNFTVIGLDGYVGTGTLSSSTTLPLPYVDATVAANGIRMNRVGTDIILTSGGTNYSTYSGYVTVYFIKNT